MNRYLSSENLLAAFPSSMSSKLMLATAIVDELSSICIDSESISFLPHLDNVDEEVLDILQ